MLGLPALEIPRITALGAVIAHLQNTHTADFQPANVTWAFVPPIETGPAARLGKRERRRLLAERALEALDGYAAALGRNSAQLATSLTAAGY
jgi:methylenetetrahydrofolate--tRNA-(uracil-5-)-methyltransferase